MKILVNIARILVGSLFIFSGLVKAIDPLGLNYKMQEFFEVWSSDGYLPGLMHWFHSHSLLLTVIMITLEVALGVALLVGWNKKLTLRLLLLLMIFFTFLTSYVLFSGKIRTCGCFGDCIPLTPIQTFTKDIILDILILFLIWKQKFIDPLWQDFLRLALVILAVLATSFLQEHVMMHLPLADCLPYKKGHNILELRKMPANAIPDKFSYSFIYEKDNVKKEFKMDNLPDSTWKFAERKQTLIEKGSNNVPLINDFSLKDSTGADSTEAILNRPHYYILFIKELDENSGKWINSFMTLLNKANALKMPTIIVTADYVNVNAFFNQQNKLGLSVYSCDGTAIKTAARSNPTLYEMKGPVVEGKYSWADFQELK